MKANKYKVGPPKKPYKLEMMRFNRVIFEKRFDLHGEAWERGERWISQNPADHTYQILDQSERQPGPAPSF